MVQYDIEQNIRKKMNKHTTSFLILEEQSHKFKCFANELWIVNIKRKATTRKQNLFSLQDRVSKVLILISDKNMYNYISLEVLSKSYILLTILHYQSFFEAVSVVKCDQTLQGLDWLGELYFFFASF